MMHTVTTTWCDSCSVCVCVWVSLPNVLLQQQKEHPWNRHMTPVQSLRTSHANTPANLPLRADCRGCIDHSGLRGFKDGGNLSLSKTITAHHVAVYAGRQWRIVISMLFPCRVLTTLHATSRACWTVSTAAPRSFSRLCCGGDMIVKKKKNKLPLIIMHQKEK